MAEARLGMRGKRPADWTEGWKAGWEGRAECGNPSCSAWLRGALKDHRRPIFERQWACSAGCMETVVGAAVRREENGAEGNSDDGQHRHRMPLGLILLAQGLITEEQLQRALRHQRERGGGRIGGWLREDCGLEQERITRAVSLQWGCPALTLEGFDPASAALAAPQLLVERWGVLPLRIAGGRIVYMGFAERPDAAVVLAVERMSGLKTESGLLDQAAWTVARERLCAAQFVDSTFEHVEDAPAMASSLARELMRAKPRASRLAGVHGFYWLRMWLESGAMRGGDGGLPASREDVVDRIYQVGQVA